MLRRIGAQDLKHRSFRALSGGQRQRVLLARALDKLELAQNRSTPLRAHLFNSSVLFMEASFSGGCSISHPAGGVNEGPLLRS